MNKYIIFLFIILCHGCGCNPSPLRYTIYNNCKYSADCQFIHFSSQDNRLLIPPHSQRTATILIRDNCGELYESRKKALLSDKELREHIRIMIFPPDNKKYNFSLKEFVEMSNNIGSRGNEEWRLTLCPDSKTLGL